MYYILKFTNCKIELLRLEIRFATVNGNATALTITFSLFK